LSKWNGLARRRVLSLAVVIVLVVAIVSLYFYNQSTSVPTTTTSVSSTPADVQQILNKLPRYYPSNYSQIIQNAKAEGKVVLYSAAAASNVQPVIQAFQQLYPFIQVQYLNMPSAVAESRFSTEVSSGKPTADMLLLSDPVGGYNLAINQSMAVTYYSPEQQFYAADLGGNSPPIKGVLFSPVVGVLIFIVNTKFLSQNMTPSGFANWASLVQQNPSFWTGRVVGYDFRQAQPDWISMMSMLYGTDRVMGWYAAYKQYGGYSLATSSGNMAEGLASGQFFAGTCALPPAYSTIKATGTILKVIFPSEGTMLYEDVSFITKAGADHYSTMLFMDFYLSYVGQTLSMATGYSSGRTDIPSGQPLSLADLQAQAKAQGSSLIFEGVPPKWSLAFQKQVIDAFAKVIS
jgi:iron(III) transport system substrate-binding protein